MTISLLNTLKRIENENEGDHFAAFYCINSAKLCLNQFPSATLGGRVCCAPFSNDPSPWTAPMMGPTAAISSLLTPLIFKAEPFGMQFTKVVGKQRP